MIDTVDEDVRVSWRYRALADVGAVAAVDHRHAQSARRSAAPARNRQEVRHLRRPRSRPRLDGRPALAARRHLGLPGHHHPGRRAARSDADRADAVRQRLADRPRARSCNRSIALHGGTQTQDQIRTSKARSIRWSACSTPRPTGATCFPAAPSIRCRSKPPTISSTATASRPASSSSSTSASRPISAPAASAGWSIGSPTATSVSLDRGCGVAVRLQARRRDHGDRRRDRDRAGRRAAVHVGRSRPDQSERWRHRQVQLHAAGRQPART